MLVEIEDKIVSTQIFERQFVCDLSACKGACCIEGNGGAPVTKEEVEIIEAHLDKILPFMRPEGIEAIEAQGVVYKDDDFEPATTEKNVPLCISTKQIQQNAPSKKRTEKVKSISSSQYLVTSTRSALKSLTNTPLLIMKNGISASPLVHVESNSMFRYTSF